MNLRTSSCLAGIAGGLVWVGRAVLDEDRAIVYWVGGALLLVWLAGVGASLVKKGTWWLRLIVAVALPLLAWSIYAAVRPTMDDTVLVDAVVGGLAVGVSVLVLVTTPRRSHSHGTHAR